MMLLLILALTGLTGPPVGSGEPITPPIDDPQEQVTAQVSAWIDELGSEDYETREKAQAQLTACGERTRATLEARRTSADPEVALRIESILRALDHARFRRLHLRLRQELTVEGGPIHSVAVSQDGRWLASGGERGDIVIWNLDRRERVARLRGHDHWVGALAFDPTGTRLVSSGRDVVLWDLSKRQEVTRQTAQTTEVDWSRDGRFIAFPSELGGITVVNALRLEKHASLRRDKGALDAVAFSRDGARVAFGNRYGGVAVFDLASRKLDSFRRISQEDDVEGLAFLPDGRLLAALEGRIVCGELELPFPGTPSAVAVSPGGQRIAASGEAGAVRVWPISALGKEIPAEARDLQGHRAWTPSLAFPSDDRLVTGSNDGRILIWNLASSDPPAELRGHASQPRSLAFTADSRTLVISGASILQAPLDDGPPMVLEGHGAVAPSATGAGFHLVREDACDLVQDGRVKSRSIQLDIREPHRAELSPDGNRLAICSTWGSAVINLETDAVTRLGRGWERGLDVAWGPRGQTLAVASVSGRHGEFGDLLLFDREGKRMHRRRVDGAVTAVAFHPSGETLCWVDTERIHVFRLQDRQEIRNVDAAVRNLRFIDEQLAVTANDTEIVFWRVPSFEPLRRHPVTGVRQLAVAPDGKHVAAATSNAVFLYAVERE